MPEVPGVVLEEHPAYEKFCSTTHCCKFSGLASHAPPEQIQITWGKLSRIAEKSLLNSRDASCLRLVFSFTRQTREPRTRLEIQGSEPGRGVLQLYPSRIMQMRFDFMIAKSSIASINTSCSRECAIGLEAQSPSFASSLFRTNKRPSCIYMLPIFYSINILPGDGIFVHVLPETSRRCGAIFIMEVASLEQPPREKLKKF